MSYLIPFVCLNTRLYNYSVLEVPFSWLDKREEFTKEFRRKALENSLKYIRGRIKSGGDRIIVLLASIDNLKDKNREMEIMIKEYEEKLSKIK